jgi:thiamine pyrophosphokinase
VDERHEVRLLHGPASATLSGAAGDLVTLLPLTERAQGITTEGLLYPLTNGSLRFGYARGVSNELTDTAATISLARGRLLVALHCLNHVHLV